MCEKKHFENLVKIDVTFNYYKDLNIKNISVKIVITFDYYKDLNIKNIYKSRFII